MPKSLRWLIAILIFFVLVYWVEKDIGWVVVLSQWQHLSILTLLGLTVLTLASYLLRAFRVYWIFGQPSHHRLIHYVRISLLHNALNNFLPMRLGEASFPLQMKYHFNQSILTSSAGLLWLRIMDLHWLLILLTLVLYRYSASLALILLSGLLVTPFVIKWLGPRIWKTLPSKLQSKLHPVREQWPSLQKLSPALYGLTALIWSIKLAALTVIMLAFISISANEALFAVITADLSSVLPIHGLAGSGTYEAAMLAALMPLGIDQQSILLAAVNVHIYLLVVTLFSVLPALLVTLPKHKTPIEPQHQQKH